MQLFQDSFFGVAEGDIPHFSTRNRKTVMKNEKQEL